MRKPARTINPDNCEVRAFDKVLEKNPPVIEWVFDKRSRVMVAVSVVDPHMDAGGANAAKTRCKYGHPFDEANTLVKTDGSRQCRTCRNAWNRARRAA